MPENKYHVWTESNVHMFRMLVQKQQLICTVSCRSSDPTVPVLVQLMVNYPMPCSTNKGAYMFNQISVGEYTVMSSISTANCGGI